MAFSARKSLRYFRETGPRKGSFPFLRKKKGTFFSFPTLCKGRTRDFRYRSIKGFSWVGVEKQSALAGRRKRIG